MNKPIELRINGENLRVSVDGNQTLLEVLRDQLGLTGVKRGCDQGDCGACTVLLDGQPINSCLALVSEAAGKEITTIEGLSKDGKLHPLQQAFVDYNAVQCGFCTPGMILTAVALLNENPNPAPAEIRQYLRGNLCRCTGYNQIVHAVQAVATRSLRQGEGQSVPPEGRGGRVLQDETVMARGKIRYFGEPVAAVAAVDVETAQRALDLIELEVEELPGVFTFEQSIDPQAPLVHEKFKEYTSRIPLKREGNICFQTRIKKGDVEKGFLESDEIFEDTYTMPVVHQAPLAPRAALAEVDS